MKPTYTSIQYSRALAALLVVFHHARGAKPWLYDPLASFNVGQAGVDIFFVISGFIMYSAARAERVGDFAYRRFVRIAPLYWLATVIELANWPKYAPIYGSHQMIVHLVKSILFIPHQNIMHPSEVSPYLVLGWTLNYEVFFYAIFAIGILSRRVLLTVSTVLLILTAVGLAVHSSNVLWLTYTNPLLLEFLGGMLIARFRDKLTGSLAIVLLPLGLVGLALSGLVEGPRVLLWGLPAGALIIGALALERSGRLPNWPWLTALGNGSYSIYLFQAIGLRFAAWLAPRLPLHGPAQLISLIAISLAAAITVGMTFHYLLERPVTRFLNRRRSSPRLDVLAAP